MNRKGITPLHFAVKKGNMQIISMLLDKGASLHKKTNKGKTPVDYARELNHQQIESVLLSLSSLFIINIFPIKY